MNARAEVAQEAARLICEGGYRDFRRAKDKALERVGFSGCPVPSNLEIADQVRSHLAVFEPDDWPRRLVRYRDIALKAMGLLRAFEPRAVGAIVDGLLTEQGAVQLHLFAEQDEAVDLFLADQGIDFASGERRLRRPDGREYACPTCEFLAEDVPFELFIFDLDDRRWAPLSPVTGRPMERLDSNALRGRMIAESHT